MDYTHTTYFPGASPYQFMGGAQVPLTPSHSNSVASDDFSNRSPPEIFDQYPNVIAADQFQNFDSNYVHQYNASQAFPGPPTPPGQLPGHIPVHAATAAAAAAVVPAPVPAAVSAAIHQPAPASDSLHVPKVEQDDQQPSAQPGSRRQGSSEEEDLNPAQSRRKAQNRAAQRAFRERKERHVKDLESRLQQLEQVQQDTASENERLKRDLQKMETENEILRATSMAAVAASSGAVPVAAVAAAAGPTTTGPMSYNPTDFYSNVLQGHTNKTPSHRIVFSDKGERLLGPGATWDLITNHDLFKSGRVDVCLVSERLRPQAKCDGQGPVFEESAILQAIEQSAAENDDLL
ncbi:hypothetical protein VTJ83DRAFT_1628 [Remersonia thermophila]|uniref:BZIP domain-containing protein n=1 Tax=Remersonia thermophila TaxID=72144 RepID=A0ABR4DIS9_9PEZI